MGWIVDEIPANLANHAQYFLAAADEVAVSSLAQPASDRPEVAVVRHPIADARNNVVGYELRFGGSIDLGDPAMDAMATSACSSTRSATSASSSSPAATPRG